MKFLTDLGIEKMNTPEVRKFIGDARCPGLTLVVQPSGKKSWIVARRLEGKFIKMKIGSFPAFKVDDARKESTRFIAAIDRGENPFAVKASEQAARKAVNDETVSVVGENWLRLDQSDKRTFNEATLFFKNRVEPAWGKRPVKSITKKDCLEFVDKYIAATSKNRGRHIFAWLHRFFNWCVERDILLYNPMAGAKKGLPNFRARVLSNTELVAIWKACDKLDGDPRRPNNPLKTNQFSQTQPIFGPIIKLLILTGARRQEICGLRWDELDLKNGVATLPGERTKRDPRHKDEPRIIYLSQKAVEILSKIKPAEGCPFVFSTTGKTPIEGAISKVKDRLDRLIKNARLEAGIKEEMPHWWLHDLRRSAATNFQRLGIRLEVTETVLGHKSGSRSGVVGIYQRYGFEKESREAVELWADKINDLLAGRFEEKVITMSKAKAS